MQSRQITETGAAIMELGGGAVRLTKTGLQLDENLTQEEWIEAMRRWRKSKTLFAAGLADLIHFGQRKFGEEVVDQALSQLEFDFQDARQAFAILELPAGLRDEALSSEHYWVLSRCNLNPEEQRKWAELAIKHKLTARLLKVSIEAGKVVTEPGGASGTGPTLRGFANVHGMGQQFRVWKSRVEPLEKWPVERKREAWEELKDVALFGVQLARELGEEI